MPATCSVTGTLYDQSGVVASNARLTVTPLSITGMLMTSNKRTLRATLAGAVSFDEVQNTVVFIQGDVLGFTQGATVTIPASSTATLQSLAAITSYPVAGATVEDEGTPLPTLVGMFNFAGAGVTVTQPSGGVALITIPGGSGGAGAWGGITGTLSDQTDLQNALDAKQNAFANQSANLVYAGPGSGADASPTFRALVALDIPDLSATYSVAAHAHSFASLTGKPTTLAGYGITDAQPVDADLTAIAALSGTSGLLKKTAADTWTLDTSTYLTSVQDAVADGATKGLAAFTAGDFDSAAGVISLDYTNAQKATGSVPGLLTAADWTTFNGKQAALGFTAVPDTRTVNGKALSGNITLGLASADFANQGTTTTVLHGNAAGNPSFGAVSLTADVSGDLPFSSFVQATAASKLVGRGDSGAGDFQEITIGSGLLMTGTTLSASGGSGATTALDNLAAVAINTSLLPSTTTINLGSAAFPFASSFTGVLAQYESVVASAGLITHNALGSATNVGWNWAPKGTGLFKITSPTVSGAAVFEVRPVSGNSFTRINDNGTVVIDSDVSTGSNPLIVKYNGSQIAGIDFNGIVSGVTLTAASGVVVADSNGVRVVSNTKGLRLGASSDVGLFYNAAGILEANNGTAGAGGAMLIRGAGAVNGQALTINSQSELLTLSTSGLTTDTTANLLPANAIIVSVTVRVTTTITTTTNWAVGDPTTAARFSSANATLTAGTTSVGMNHMQGSVATDAAGPVQTAAAKVRITCTGSNPGAGAIRITVHYILLGAATS